ncbi:General secretion pathway protein K [Pseudohaliea rubra DSM 19751]|uniref:General secretion pathway protein K n=1 Tax=Pseudohaliea rubra DSM 19751 TaxID=1265313 RepID=A0A095VTF6_9GAMM|nr:General secretion pathway protein K [Pseudohaliea rubra DSM 19751]
MALAVVVWFIAGMSLLVAGIVSRATVDARLAQAHLARAQAEAAGDGAINLLLADLLEGQFAASGDAPVGSYRLGEWRVRVLAMPTAALVDLNAAPAQQLARLFRDYGKTAGDAAPALAASVVEWRRTGGQQPPRSVRFDVVEDLLQVEGMTRTRLDDIRHMVTASGGATGRAPRLEWVAARSPEMIAREGLPETGSAGRRGAGGRGATSYRIDALVELGGRHWLRRRWVELGAGRGSALPWSSRRVEPARVVGGAP